MRRSIRHGFVMVWLALLTIAIGGGQALAVPQDGAAQAEAIEQARALQADGRWADAATAWGRITTKDESNGMAWFNLGYCLHAAGRLDEAIQVHQQAASFDDYRGIATYNLGCAYALTNRPEAALDALAKAQAAGFSLRGRAEEDSDLESLWNDPRFTALLEREPEPGPRGGGGGEIFEEIAQLVMGHVHQFMQEHGTEIEQLVQDATQHAMIALGQVQERLAQDERFAGIAQMMQQWMGGAGQSGRQPRQDDSNFAAKTPKSPARADVASLIREAQQHAQSGNWEDAVAAYEAVVMHEPDDGEVWFGYAYSLHMSGDYETAIKAHQKAASFEPFRGIALYNLACAYALTGHTDEAFEALAASREAGFDIADAMESDSDLDSLRDDARFEEMLEGAGATVH